jgi:hypothetical protein
MAPPLRKSSLGLVKDRVGNSNIFVVGANGMASRDTIRRLSVLRWIACVRRQVFCKAQNFNPRFLIALRKVHSSVVPLKTAVDCNRAGAVMDGRDRELLLQLRVLRLSNF